MMNENHQEKPEKRKINKKWYALIISVVVLIILYCIPIFRPIYL